MSTENIINSSGVFLILLAFLLLTLNKLKSEDKIYNGLNLVGALLACYGSYLIEAIPFVILEGTWALVALYGLLKNRK